VFGGSGLVAWWLGGSGLAAVAWRQWRGGSGVAAVAWRQWRGGSGLPINEIFFLWLEPKHWTIASNALETMRG